MKAMRGIAAGSGIDAKRLLAATGVVFGAAGTTPLYLMDLVVNESGGDAGRIIIYGALSSVFWTFALIAGLKFFLLALETSNRGEGGLFALFALLRNKSSRASLFVIGGGSALLASSAIAPAITLTASVEGARELNQSFPVIPVVAVILLLLFLIQRFRSGFVTNLSGPVMLIWFLMIGITGFLQIVKMPEILAAVNPVYAFELLSRHPEGLVVPGMIFLCVAGIEAVYQEMGAYGKSAIRVSGLSVALMLMLSFFGQGAWLLSETREIVSGNPFFGMISDRFLAPAVIISIMAALVASQSIINRTFTLVSEAVSLNFWPNIKILHPTQFKGQVYMPLINWIIWSASTLYVIIFREVAEMGPAYGLVLSFNMIAFTVLFAYYYRSLERILGKRWLTIPLLVLVEAGYLFSVLYGFNNSEWFALFLTLFFLAVMLGWYFGRKIKNRHISFANISDYADLLTELHRDSSVPITATNLVYIIKANRPDQVESKVIYSILHRQPKRAETYWFLHIDRVDEPDRFDYEFNPIIPGILHRVDFHLGFKVEPRINLYFREVLEDLVASKEIDLSSSYDSLRKFNFTGDFKYILIDRVMLRDNKLTTLENFLLSLHGFSRLFDITDERALNLDLTNTIVEKIPVTLAQPEGQRIIRAK